MKCWGCKTKLDLLTSIRIHLGDDRNMLCPKCKIWGMELPGEEHDKKHIPNTRRLCQSCKTEYQLRIGDLSQCPNCESIYWTLLQEPEDDSKMISSATSKNSYLENPQKSDFDRLIAAQNKTTHAVRAFVRFLFIQLTGITLAVFFWNLSTISVDQQSCFVRGTNCEGNSFLQLMAVAVWVAAVILSSRAGWSELEKSNID